VAVRGLLHNICNNQKLKIDIQNPKIRVWHILCGTNDFCTNNTARSYYPIDHIVYDLRKIVDSLLAENKYVNLLKPPPKFTKFENDQITAYWQQVELSFLNYHENCYVHTIPWPKPACVLIPNNVHLSGTGSTFFENMIKNIRIPASKQFFSRRIPKNYKYETNFFTLPQAKPQPQMLKQAELQPQMLKQAELQPQMLQQAQPQPQILKLAQLQPQILKLAQPQPQPLKPQPELKKPLLLAAKNTQQKKTKALNAVQSEESEFEIIDQYTDKTKISQKRNIANLGTKRNVKRIRQHFPKTTNSGFEYSSTIYCLDCVI